MKWSQIKYLTAMMLIGDGVLAMLRPHRDAQAWRMGPQPWQALMEYLSDHPDMLRAIGAAEAAVGLMIAASEGTAEDKMAEEAAAMRARIRTIA